MSLKQAADEGVAFEKRVAALQQRGQLRQVERLQVAAHVQHRKPFLRSQGLDLRSWAEMIVHTVPFAGAGVAAVEEHHLLQAPVKVGMEAREGAVKWALAG